ncbi:MAG: hypothetical protein M0Z92_06645 [Actinomycetota bacterium]|nr:hypothetical protein [Actinomycetota bacterium]
MPEQNPTKSETANITTTDGASHPAGDEQRPTDEPRSVEDLRVEIWAAVREDILAAQRIDRIVDQTSAETAFRVSANIAALSTAGGAEYRARRREARRRILALSELGGEASSHRAFVRSQLWDSGVRSGWRSEADVEKTASDGVEWHHIKSLAYRAASDAMDAALFRDFLTPEQFGILVEPLHLVVGAIWEGGRRH